MGIFFLGGGGERTVAQHLKAPVCLWGPRHYLRPPLTIWVSCFYTETWNNHVNALCENVTDCPCKNCGCWGTKAYKTDGTITCGSIQTECNQLGTSKAPLVVQLCVLIG
jgi:hypothetical protein